MHSRLLASVFLLAAMLASPGPLAAKTAQVAALTFRPLSDQAWAATWSIFTEALRQHGWIEGQNLNLTLRSTDGHDERAAGLAAELVAQSPDVIVTINYPNTKAVSEKTSTIPIVMFGVPDPVRLGLIASLPRPGGNITGVSTQTEDTLDKSLQLIKEIQPGASRIAVITYGAEPYWGLARNNYAAAAQHVGVTVDPIPVQSAADLEAALARVAAERPDALIVSSTPVFAVSASGIATFAIEHRLPTLTFQTQMARDGLLMSYEPEVPELLRSAAGIVDKILRGAKPLDIPVEQPTQFRFVINAKTAHALGREIPSSLLTRADEIVE